VGQYVTIPFKQATTDQIVNVNIPLNSYAISQFEAAGFAVGNTISLLKAAGILQAVRKAQQAAISASKASGQWWDNYQGSVEEGMDNLEVALDASDADVADAIYDVMDAAAEAADEIAIDTVEITFADIGTAVVGILLSIAADILSVVTAVEMKNQTTLVFQNMAPNTYLIVKPKTHRGKWFASQNAQGNGIAGSDTDEGISRIYIGASEDAGGTQSFTMEPTGDKCQRDLKVDLLRASDDTVLTTWSGAFYNPVTKKSDKSSYSMSLSSGSDDYRVQDPVVSAEYEGVI
jgi:hypothetical protein